jgi:hypothetical protein
VREREQQPGVAQHAGQRGLQLDRADRAQVPEQVGDPRARQSRAQQAREERDRHRDQRARGDPEDELRLLAADELHDEHQREQQQASRSRHPGQERATARRRRRPVASAEYQRGTHGDRDEQHPLEGVQGGRDPRVVDDQQQVAVLGGEHEPRRGEHEHLQQDGGDQHAVQDRAQTDRPSAG